MKTTVDNKTHEMEYIRAIWSSLIKIQAFCDVNIAKIIPSQFIRVAIVLRYLPWWLALVFSNSRFHTDAHLLSNHPKDWRNRPWNLLLEVYKPMQPHIQRAGWRRYRKDYQITQGSIYLNHSMLLPKSNQSHCYWDSKVIQEYMGKIHW